MNPNQAILKLTYDKVKDGLFSVKLRICYQNQRPRYHLPVKEGVLIKPDVYKRLMVFHQTRSERTGRDIQNLYALIAPFIKKAQSIIDAMAKANAPFSFARFEQQFYGQAETTPHDVLSYLDKLSAQMEREGRVGNADAYANARKSLQRFMASLTSAESKVGRELVLPFEQITPEWLSQYEAWMLRFGRLSRKKNNPVPERPATLTTVGIYLRQVRAAFNAAINDKVIAETVYPFGAKLFVIPTGSNPKKALRKSVIRQIIEYPCEPGSFEERGRDLWVLSYLSNGMNLSDIASLRWEQISYAEESITFVRNKTSRSRRGNQTKVVAALFPESRAIIERWAAADRTQTGYVFPFLTEQMSARRKKMIVTQVINITNKYMKRIGKTLGVSAEIRTYEARHSFASALLKSGADPVYIKDKLGQSTLKSTESYLTTILDEDEQSVLRKSLLDD